VWPGELLAAIFSFLHSFELTNSPTTARSRRTGWAGPTDRQLHSYLADSLTCQSTGDSICWNAVATAKKATLPRRIHVLDNVEVHRDSFCNAKPYESYS
jgi:hypothetical protein